LLIYIIAGLTTGSIFGLAAVGVVLTYKTSGIFNFAQGALATLSAFLFYFLQAQHGVPWPVAAMVCILVAGPLMGLVLELLARRLATRDLPTKVMGTIGLLLFIQGGLYLLYPPGPYRGVTQFLPSAAFSFFGTPVQAYRVIIFAIGGTAVAALTIFLRRSRSGVAMRGVVDDPDLLDISGTSPARIRRLSWVIGSTFAAASGVLLAPLLTLDPTTFTLLIVTAFGAAAIGAFTSLPLTYLGGLLIGIAQAVLQKYIINSSGLLSGLPASLPFLVLFLLLLFAPRLRRPSTARIPPRSQADTWQPPATLRGGALVVLVGVLCAVPAFAGLYLADWTRFLAYMIVFLSLGLLVRMSGQVSLAQVSFMAIGVCAFSDLAVGHHWPWFAALLAAGLIAAPIGAVLAIPAIRFPGLYLALATLGFGILVEQMFYGQSYMFGSYGLGKSVPMPQLSWLGLTGPNGYYYLVLVIVLVLCVVTVMINHSRLGRLLRAMGDSARGLASVGASINVSRVLVFVLAACLAAVGGVLDAGALGTVGPAYYDPMLSLQLFVVILLTVGGVPWYAILAAAAQTLIPAYISSSATVGYALTAIFGLGAIQMAMTGPGFLQLPSGLRNAIDRYFPPVTLWKRAARRPSWYREAAGSELPDSAPATAGGGLRVDGVTVRYGGLVAADHISLTAAAGKITGLIGPNGAGKTTVFNACAGAVHTASGSVYLNGERFDGLGPAVRARRGLGRTFQQMELFDSLRVRDNVALGCEGGYAGRNPLDHLFSRRRQRAAVRQRTSAALDMCGIAELADTPVRNLATGQRRLVEMARCLAGRFTMLLLDEPSSGLDPVETRHFGEILTRAVRARNVGILLIEHDMALVNQVCDYVYVVDFGKNLFDGTAAQASASDVVRAAYLGEDDTLAEPASTQNAEERRDSLAPIVPVAAEPPRSADRAAVPVLSFSGLTSGYGATTVLRDVSFDVQPGQVVALLGPNGAGKTTLLRTACGIVRPIGGRITLGGTEITALPPYQRTSAGLCLIPEGRGIFRSLSVQENIRLQLPPRTSDSRDAIERALTVFPALGRRMKQVAGTLSGGEQQMLALARAYLTSPQVILLDEISMGLAPLVVDQMFRAMRDLASTGTAMLVVEQYVTRAMEMADAVVLLDKGAVSYSGPSAELDEATILRGYLKGDVSGAGDPPAVLERSRELAVPASCPSRPLRIRVAYCLAQITEEEI